MKEYLLNPRSRSTIARLLLVVVLPSLLVTMVGCATAPKGVLPPQILTQGQGDAGEVLLVTPSLPSADREGAEMSSGPVVVGERTIYIDELTPVSSYGSSTGFLEKCDWMHDALFMAVERTAKNVDGRFASDNAAVERVPVSRFRVGLYVDAIREAAEVSEDDAGDSEEGGTKVGLDTDFDIDIELPNVESSLSLFLTTEELGELPGTDPSDRDQGLRIGLRKILPADFSVSAGIKWDWPPEPFARIGWDRLWRPGKWKLYPAVKGFWKLEDGFGSSADITSDRWFGRGLLRASTGGRWTETTDDLEWSQTFILGYAKNLIDERKMGGRAKGRDLARGSGLRYRISGDTETGHIQKHQGLLFLKFPVRKRWAYFVLAPEVTFRNECDWKAEPGIQVGLDMLFWNVGDR